MHRIYYTCICFIFVFASSFSQNTNKRKYELIGGIGFSGFLGDVGGASSNGTHFVKDYNFLSTRFCINAGVRHRFNSKISIKSMLSYAMVSGNDALSKDVIRKNRNLNFRSTIIELSVQAEYYFLHEKSGNQEPVHKLKIKRKKRTLTAYLFTGIGLFYYNPQEYLNGAWYNIKNYHTEGQGLPNGPKQFSNYCLAIPFGIGVKKILNNRWSIAAEFGFRKTFTDYIDGVSTIYYDKTKLEQAYGHNAESLADPNLGRIDGATMTGQERGNSKYKDSYMFLTVNLAYKITSKLHRSRVRF